MVEFGLKLQDNKVSEWSQYYIDYEKLKGILDRCAAVLKRYDEHLAKRPEHVQMITDAYRQGFSTPHASQVDLLATDDTNSMRGLSPNTQLNKEENEETVVGMSLHSIHEGKDESGSSAASEAEVMINERTELMDSSLTSVLKYGSERENKSLRNVESTGNILRKALDRATSGVSDFLQRSFERTVRDTLQEIDRIDKEFEDCLLENIERVNTFYHEKQKELYERVNFLKESAALLHRAMARRKSSSMDDEEIINDDYLVSPLRSSSTHRRKSMTPIIVANSFARKVSALTRKKLVAEASVHTIINDADDEEEVLMDEEAARRSREVDSIQRALVDHYRTAKLLHNFAIMNYTGFVKIIKKYDKIMPKENRRRFDSEISSGKICDEGQAIEDLADMMEKLYANWFCDRSVSEARAQMLTKKGDGLEMDWSQLRLGYRMGMCSILALWVCWDCIWGLIAEGHSTIGGRTAFPVFRGCAGLLTLQWCWGLSVWVWTRFRVNYIYLFDFNPYTVGTPLAIFNEAVDNTLFYLICSLLYYKSGAHDLPGPIPPGVFPFVLVVYTSYQLIFPIRTRMPMWEAILDVVTAPLKSPTFFHGYIGDIFTSMVKVFQDLAWTACFVFSGNWLVPEDEIKMSKQHEWTSTVWYSKILIPLLTLLPLWIRFNQCLRRYLDTKQRFPHLANAFKYALSQTVTLFGAFHPLYMRNNFESELFQSFWLFVFVASSLYSFTWDVYMDWGLGLPKYRMLGPRLMYPKTSMYYAIICIDLVLRFAWVLTLIPPNSGAKFALPAYLTLVSMILEIFRRTLWGYLRLENEHRSNTAGFRRVGFVPLHFSTGHQHGYKHENEHRGVSVLVEVVAITALVLAAAVTSVVAAQRATERAMAIRNGEL